MITEEMYEMEIPIIIDKDLVTYEYDSFARGFHVYMDIWNPVIGEILKCKREPTNEVNKHAVAIMCSDSLGKESVVGQIPHNISKFSSMFLTIPSTAIVVEVLGKRVNRGSGYGLEIPVKYRYYGQEKLIQWLAKKLEAVKKELECKISKCLKQIAFDNPYFF